MRQTKVEAGFILKIVCLTQFTRQWKVEFSTQQIFLVWKESRRLFFSNKLLMASVTLFLYSFREIRIRY